MAAEKGKKDQSGTTKKRTVLKLEPVKYQITLYFLGDERIRKTLMPGAAADPNRDPHSPATAYRCVYEFERGTWAQTNPPVKISNEFRTSSPAEEDKKAATPAADGGDQTNPKSDQLYRIMITDNHGARDTDLSDTGRNLLGKGADTHSRVDNYALEDAPKINWMPDISPAIPLRIVVRKFFGYTQVPIEEDLSAIVEIKDPVEEFAQNDGKRKEFLTRFFNKYNKGSVNPDVGADNDPINFVGQRNHNAPVAPGVNAADVLRLMPDLAGEKFDATPTEKHKVKFSDLTAVPLEGTNAKLVLKQKGTELFGEARFVDFAFLPWPAGGDNYRFLIKLVDSGGTDIRDKEENGAKCELLDDMKYKLDKPYSYMTGRFVVWKKVKIRLVILCNRIGKFSGLEWGKIKDMYKKVFMEIVEPDFINGYRELDVDGWLKELEDFFTAKGDAPGLVEINRIKGLSLSDKNAEYKKWFFPQNHFHATYSKVDLKEWTKNPFTKNIVNRVCDIAPKIDSPYRSLGQTDQLPGLFVVFTAEPTPQCPAVGAYVGDRTFWMLNQLNGDGTENKPSTTSTTAHEMGHTFYLRHSHTDYSRTKVNLFYKNKDGTADGAPPGGDADGQVVLLNVSRDNSNLEDHDQHDAYHCLQAYSRPITAEPCGVCALVLRFYDRVKMAASGEFRSGIDDGVSPMIMAKFISMAGSNYNANVYKLNGAHHELPDVRKNTNIFLLALGKKTNFTTRSGAASVGRINATIAHEGPADDATTFWSKESGPAVTFTTQGDFMKVTAGATLGDVVIKYSRGGQSVTAMFKIVN